MAEKKDKNVHAGHRQRMRDRVINNGVQSLHTHELLEMILYYTNPRINTNEMAHKLINEYGNLSMLYSADRNDLLRRCGVNEATAVFFEITAELLRRFDEERWVPGKLLDSTNLAGEYAKFLLSHEKKECFYLICLDSQSRLISSALISVGTVSETYIYIRSVVEAVIKFNAKSVILVHNHPGGSLVPTGADIDTTVNITKALSMIEVFVLDHIIVAKNEYLSMTDKGLI